MRRLPLFPLPVVLFPGASLPLHIFEPRYRQMVAHCLEGNRCFGLVYHDSDRHGGFEMQGQVGCVAEIQDFQPLPDGRSLLLVRGGERFRIEDGIESETLYYEGLVDEYRDAEDETADLVERRQASIHLFERLLQRLTEAPGPLPPIRAAEETSFQVAQWIRVHPQWQQELLLLRNERERLDRLDVLLCAALNQLE